MYQAKFVFVGGYSRIDHLGTELARLAEENTKPCKTVQGAISNGRAALRRALEDHPVSSIRSGPPRVDVGAELIRKQVALIVDVENNAEDFWDFVRESRNEAPWEIKKLLDDDRIIVQEDRSRVLRQWCLKTPGFRDGPAYAREAILFQDVEA